MINTRAMPTQQTTITGVSRRITAGQEIKAGLCRDPAFWALFAAEIRSGRDLPCPAPPVTMPTNPAPRKRNGRHIADQAVTVPIKASIPVCTVDDVFNRRFNDGPQAGRTAARPRPRAPQRPSARGSHWSGAASPAPTATRRVSPSQWPRLGYAATTSSVTSAPVYPAQSRSSPRYRPAPNGRTASM